MATKFDKLQIKAEPKSGGGERVIKVDLGKGTQPVDFELPKINKPGDQNYAAVKKKYGPLAGTDPDRKPKTPADSRFALNPLLRDPLFIEQEEKRMIEQRVREQVAIISEKARVAAETKGYEDGKKRGHDEAYEQFFSESKERLDRFDAFLAACEDAKRSIFKANERFLIDLIYRIARMLILRELSADREYVVRLAQELIERVGARENISVRINRGESNTINLIREKLRSTFGELQNLNVEVSTRVESGGCIVETDWSSIDARIETQMAGIYDSLIGVGPGASTDTEPGKPESPSGDS